MGTAIFDPPISARNERSGLQVLIMAIADRYLLVTDADGDLSWLEADDLKSDWRLVNGTWTDLGPWGDDDDDEKA